jgi:hypothetical protein
MSSILLQIHGSLRRFSVKEENINIRVIFGWHLDIIAKNTIKNRMLNTQFTFQEV